jgi:hypothetical protein
VRDKIEWLSPGVVIAQELPACQRRAATGKYRAHQSVIDRDRALSGIRPNSVDGSFHRERGNRSLGGGLSRRSSRRWSRSRRCCWLSGGCARRGRRHQPLISRENDKCQQYCDEKTTFHLHGLRNWIQARSAERMAAENALETHPSAAKHTVGRNRFGGIFRAGR